MSYTLDLTPKFEKQFKKLDRFTQKFLKHWIDERLDGCENPRAFGKGLTANKSGLWRYRIGDYRVICDIQDDKLVVLALTIGHRSEVYKR